MIPRSLIAADRRHHACLRDARDGLSRRPAKYHAEQVRLRTSRRGAGAGDRRPHAENPVRSTRPPPLYRQLLPGSKNGSVPSYKFWFYTSVPDLYRIARATNRA